MGEEKPRPLEGWLEKKTYGTLRKSFGIGNGEFQRFYVRVDEETGCLYTYSSGNTGGLAVDMIDLRMANEVVPYVRTEGGEIQADYSRFNIDIGGKVFKFKAPSEKAGRKWTNGLNEWRDYFLLNM